MDKKPQRFEALVRRRLEIIPQEKIAELLENIEIPSQLYTDIFTVHKRFNMTGNHPVNHEILNLFSDTGIFQSKRHWSLRFYKGHGSIGVIGSSDNILRLDVGGMGTVEILCQILNHFANPETLNTLLDGE